ncbi:hypothetical protein Q3G72_010916 [Acer saccharum]|nr:hypothetical protein Q3G72_010916 [Acer saccharum]
MHFYLNHFLVLNVFSDLQPDVIFVYSIEQISMGHMMALLLMNIHGIQFSMLTQLGLRPKELNNIRAVGKDENVKLSYNGDIQYQLFEDGEVAGKGNFWLAVK